MFPSLVGKTFGQARRSFTGAVLCGTLDPVTKQAHLNPADSSVLTDQQRLVFLSRTAKISKPSEQVPCLNNNPSCRCVPDQNPRVSAHRELQWEEGGWGEGGGGLYNMLAGSLMIKPTRNQVACLTKKSHCCELKPPVLAPLLAVDLNSVVTKSSNQVASSKS